jgi:hypothetical protein
MSITSFGLDSPRVLAGRGALFLLHGDDQHHDADG